MTHVVHVCIHHKTILTIRLMWDKTKISVSKYKDQNNTSTNNLIYPLF